MNCLHTDIRWMDHGEWFVCNLCSRRYFFAGDGSFQPIGLRDDTVLDRHIKLIHDMRVARDIERNYERLAELYEEYQKAQRQAEEQRLNKRT